LQCKQRTGSPGIHKRWISKGGRAGQYQRNQTIKSLISLNDYISPAKGFYARLSETSKKTGFSFETLVRGDTLESGSWPLISFTLN
jgi:hypothetical protein